MAAPVTFYAVQPGDLGVLVRWTSAEPASSYVVLRSERAVSADESEQVYAGTLNRHFERWTLPPHAHLLVDRDARTATTPLWYAVLALAAPPSPLRVLHPQLQPIEGPSIDPYSDPPAPELHHHSAAPPGPVPLTFLDDDPRAAAAINAMARALSGRP